MINCYCPANGKLLGKVAPAYPEDIDDAIAKAAAAQQQWAKTSFDERKKVLRTLQKYVLYLWRYGVVGVGILTDLSQICPLEPGRNHHRRLPRFR